MTSAWPSRILAGAFIASGVLHVVRPRVFEPLIPPALPWPTTVVVGTGVVEVVCVAGLLLGRAWAPKATAATLLAVWPGNIWHAVRTQQSSQSPWVKAGVWARVPMQIPLVGVALRAPTRV